MTDFCQYVDPFYGNGEVDHFAETGPASKWFYIKALCGNTIPHATLPFGKMSVGPFSGGYPTGYGNHFPNSCGGIRKLFEGNMARGFSHLHQSGTGGIRYYYNYAVTTPFYGKLDNISVLRELKDETAQTGFYSCRLDDILCEFTVNGGTAVHRYTFGEENGRIAVDFSNDGLHPDFGDWWRGTVTEAEVSIAKNKIFFSGILSGIKLYFCIHFEGKVKKLRLFEGNSEKRGSSLSAESLNAPFGVVADLSDKELLVKVSYSTVSFKKAEQSILSASGSFENLCDRARNVWNRHLSVIRIDAEPELMTRFYSALYHSLVKPCDLSGERVLGVKGDVVTGLATLWDQYKTLYPLIFTFYPDMGKKLVRGLANISRSLGKIPCSFGLTDIFPCEEQAKMLGIFALLDALYADCPEVTPALIDECIDRELAREDFASFLKEGVFERYTHILDTADALFCAAGVTEDEVLKKKYLTLADNLEKAYGKDGLLSENSPYYEGDRYTYSFRLEADMEKRIKLAGGKERFVSLLDDFFGFGKESLRQLTEIGIDPAAAEPNHHRFEGFNNECDMESPYAYIYADRNDRTCEIIHASITDTFLSGRGGLPGNNDSGGLTSCYVWNMLGLFPVAGKGEFLFGSPHVKKAMLVLSNGKRLEIMVEKASKTSYITDSVEFNGQILENFRISTRDLMSGGKLVFRLI